FFQAEDGIRDRNVTGVQTCALPILSASVPFAFGIAALASGQLGDQWIRSVRRWALFSWSFLTLGNLLGARWAYEVLGWGGYWARSEERRVGKECGVWWSPLQRTRRV